MYVCRLVPTVRCLIDDQKRRPGSANGRWTSCNPSGLGAALKRTRSVANCAEMGNSPTGNPEQTSNADVADQQCATFSDNVWMISCRPFSAACDTFSPTTFLFQPDTRILSNSYEYSYDRELEGYCVEQTVGAVLRAPDPCRYCPEDGATGYPEHV